MRLDQKKTWFLGVNYFFMDTQQVELGLLKSMMSLDLSIKKNWNDWTFVLNAKDIFGRNFVEVEDIQANGSFKVVKNDQFRRNVMLSLTYSFGNQQIKKA